MQKYISKRDGSDIRYYDENVNVGDYINLVRYRIMTNSEVKKHETPKPSDYHNFWDGEQWIDKRTDDQKCKDEISNLPALTRRQFRLVLVSNGFNLSDIENKINSIEDDLQRQIIQIEWEDSQNFERTSESLNTMAALLGLDDQKVNELWYKALEL